MTISRSFDFIGGSSSKFWEVTCDGIEVVVRYGRTGTTGQTTSRAFTTEEAAAAHVDKLITQKLGKGYRERETGVEQTTEATVEATPSRVARSAVAPTDEDTFVLPPASRRHVFARRGDADRSVREPDAAAHATALSLLTTHAEVIEQTLRHPRAEPEVAAAGLDLLAGEPSPLGLAAVAAALVARASSRRQQDGLRVLGDLWLADHGLPVAAAAAAELSSLGWGYRGYQHHESGVPLRHLRPGESRDYSAHEGGLTIAGRIRAALAAAAAADEYAAALDALAPYRQGTLHQRVAAAFLAPTETGWHDEVVTAVAAAGDVTLSLILLTAVTDPAHVAQLSDLGTGYWTVPSTALVWSITAAAGAAAAPILTRWFDDAYGGTDVKRPLLAALAALPGDEPFQLLLDRFEQRAVPAALLDAAGRFPVRALRLFAADARRGVRDLLRAHVLAHPEVAERALPALPGEAAGRVRAILGETATVSTAPAEASAEALPALLRRPPWTVRRATRRPVVVDGLICPDVPAMRWRPGERDAWRDTRGHTAWAGQHPDWESVAARVRDGRAYWYETVDFLVRAPEELARPALPDWRPVDVWDGNLWMPRVVGRFELDALPAALGAARRSPAALAGTLLPYAAPEVATSMAEWLGRLKSARQAALAWLTRHPAAAARALVPPALGRPGAERRHAERALWTLAGNGYAEHVRTAAQQYGPAAAVAIDELLAVDPLDVLPARIPRLPEWADPARLPRIRMRDPSAVLPLPATGHVATMLAISRPGEPYAGVGVVRELCDPRSLADFAWAIFVAWQAAGNPAKEGWVLDALALVGDDEVVRRLAPVIRAWPGEGGHARAVAGLDVLAAIGTDVALMHLHGIAQKVKFKGLRERANAKMREVAAGLGLDTEQLADRLVPDLGLDATGSLTLDYGPRRFVVSFDEQLKPYVRDTDGKRRKDLPRPGANDDPVAAPAAYQLFAALNKDVRTIATDQIRRLERAMVTRRRWTGAELRQFFVGHPLLWHLARRLLWGRYDAQGALVGALRVAEDRTFADVDDEPVTLRDDDHVGVVHPLEFRDSVAAWTEVFADYEILQPFPQLGREVHTLTELELAASRLTRFEGKTVHFGKVLGLERRGWQRTDPEDAGIQGGIERPLPGGGGVVIWLNPGIALGFVEEFAEQKFEEIWVRRAEDDHWGSKRVASLGDLDPVVLSEIIRDLKEITA